MSLINDALKRAKEAHESLPPPPPTAAVPQFRPVEPAEHQPGIGPGVMLLGALCLLLLLGLMISWVWVQRNGSKAPGNTPAPVPAETAKTVPAPVPAPAPAPTVAATPAPAPVVPSEPIAPARAVVTPPEPAVVVPVEPPAPVKPALRLQGIAYSPVRPAAMISGKTLFIGDKTGEWRVVAIDQESATLVSAGQTNILTLPQ